MTQARSVVTAIAIFLAFASVVVVLWLGAQDVIDRRMSAGVLLQFLLYAVLGASALGQLSEVWNEVSQAAGAAARIGDLLALKPAIVAPAAPAALPSPVRGAVRLRARHLRLSDAAGRSGAAAASTSPSRRARRSPSSAPRAPASRRCFSCWSGSTIPRAGAVRLDGVDIAQLDPKALRRAIALVPQEPFIFGASVADNIAYGRPGAAREEIEDAATPRRRAWLRRRAAAGLRHAARRARRDAVGRRAPAPRHRPRHPQGRAGAAARRGDLGARRRQRDAGAGGARRN